MSKEIIYEVDNFKKNNNFFLEIEKRLNSRMNYLSYKLNYSEAYTDLTISLFNILKNLDTSKFLNDNEILKYLNKCLNNSAIKLYYQQKKYKEFIVLDSEIENTNIKYSNFLDEDFSEIYFLDLISCLNDKEKDIIYKKFKLQLSDVEIANYYNVSRQAINQTKNRALNKIKNKYLLDN